MKHQYYEYAIEVTYDKFGGSANTDAMMAILSTYSKGGWRLASVFTNELGKNALSVSGLGVNSTSEQTIMIFERPVKSPEDLPIFEKTFPVTQCNISKPILPKKIDLKTFKNRGEVALSVFTNSNDSIEGVACDITIENIFKDVYVVENVYLLNFKLAGDMYYHSTAAKFSLPESFSHSISNVYITFRKYVMGGKVIEVENREIETESFSTGSFDRNAFIFEVESCVTGAEMVEYVKKYDMENPGFFSSDVIVKLQKRAELERIYGNMSSDILKTLNEYLDEMNV